MLDARLKFCQKRVLTVKHGRYNRPPAWREAHALRVVGERKHGNDVSDHRKEPPRHVQPKLRLLEQREVEGDVDGADGLVAVPDDQADCPVHHKGKDGDDAKGPLESQVLDHGVGGQGVDEAAEAGAAGRQGVGEGPTLREPLGDDADGRGKAEAKTDAKADSLA